MSADSKPLTSDDPSRPEAVTQRVPRVSVGLPVYNGERYVAEAIESILAQTFTDFELVISDNASTDRTQEICLAYSSRDPRIRYSRNPVNIGGSGNFSRVFELSRAPLFKWAAHDDLCGPTFLERCLEVFDANPGVIVCYPRIGFIDFHGTVIGDHDAGCNLRSSQPSERVRQFLFSAASNCLPTFGLIRREMLGKTLLLAPFVSSDKVLLFQLALLGEFCEIPERLFFFREYPDRSIWKYKSFAEYTRWHNPNSKTRFQLPRWRLFFEYYRSVAGAGIPLGEAAKCYFALTKSCYWNRRVLVRDFVMLLRQVAAFVRGRPPVEDMKSARVVQDAPGFSDGGGNGAPSAVQESASGSDKL